MTFKDKVIYQIYPKSYKDSNGDGIGDLKGIKEKLPYLNDLGIDMIWLNPIYPSPQKDNGYDISDYTAIDPIFGTMEEFEQLIAKAKEYQIQVMLDMVLNHVSTEHEWFKKALAGDQYYQDFFILREEPTDWVSKFGGSAWSPFGDTGKYYLHLYDQTQADLNWRNQAVREELFKVLVDPETDLILGASIYAEDSHEVINLISLAMNGKLPYTLLRDQIYSHPTMSEALNDVLK